MTLATDLEISPFPDSSDVNLVWKNYPTPTSSPLRKLHPIRSTTTTTTTTATANSNYITSAADLDTDRDDAVAAANPNTNKRPTSSEIVLPHKRTRLEQAAASAAPDSTAANMLLALHHHAKSEPVVDSENQVPTPTTPLERFIHDRVHKLMDKQDQMQNQLTELIKTHENNRIIREQAWNLQLSHFYQTAQHMRNQQITRNLSIISFLQTLSKKTTTTKRWPQSEVKALVSFRAAMDPNHKHHNLWEHISSKMSSVGYTRDANKCKEKWDNINKYYLRRTAAKQNNVHSAKTCLYFHDLDLLYKNRLSRGSSEELNTSYSPEKTSN